MSVIALALAATAGYGIMRELERSPGNYAFGAVGAGFGYFIPTLRANSFVAAFLFAGQRRLGRQVVDEMRDQRFGAWASR